VKNALFGNVTRIENEFCKILPNEISMEKEHIIKALEKNSSFQIKLAPFMKGCKSILINCMLK
jgi:hypothetical protein